VARSRSYNGRKKSVLQAAKAEGKEEQSQLWNRPVETVQGSGNLDNFRMGSIKIRAYVCSGYLEDGSRRN